MIVDQLVEGVFGLLERAVEVGAELHFGHLRHHSVCDAALFSLQKSLAREFILELRVGALQDCRACLARERLN